MLYGWSNRIVRCARNFRIFFIQLPLHLRIRTYFVQFKWKNSRLVGRDKHRQTKPTERIDYPRFEGGLFKKINQRTRSSDLRNKTASQSHLPLVTAPPPSCSVSRRSDHLYIHIHRYIHTAQQRSLANTSRAQLGRSFSYYSTPLDSERIIRLNLDLASSRERVYTDPLFRKN